MQQNFFLSEMESGLDEWLKNGGVNFLLGKKQGANSNNQLLFDRRYLMINETLLEINFIV